MLARQGCGNEGFRQTGAVNDFGEGEFLAGLSQNNGFQCFAARAFTELAVDVSAELNG